MQFWTGNFWVLKVAVAYIFSQQVNQTPLDLKQTTPITFITAQNDAWNSQSTIILSSTQRRKFFWKVIFWCFWKVPGAIHISLRYTQRVGSVTDNTTRERTNHHTAHSHSHHVPSLHRRPICRWRKLNQYLFLKWCWCSALISCTCLQNRQTETVRTLSFYRTDNMQINTWIAYVLLKDDRFIQSD